ncbi:MAG: NhaP-type Na+/H+ or K+/H+ antiporter [Patiriisocius sp.]|jgi:NhaP-type Na+/H+ or K+/H+ antiporter
MIINMLLIAHLDYYMIIAMAVIIILSYFFNILAKKTNIPSVLMLLILGIGVKYGLDTMGFEGIQEKIDEYQILPIIGTIGLILIVLEAALDLKLSKDKWPVIWRSFVVALLSLLVTSFAVAYILDILIFNDFFKSLVYAIPLSIMSSAIIIPSVGGLKDENKEFMIYESTFSDILGIMFFFFVLGNDGTNDASVVMTNVSGNIFITIVASLLISFVLVWVFQKITSNIKLFLVIAILMLLYAIGKLFHFSSLVLILVFGLMLNNHELFFKGRLKKLINTDNLNPLLRDFHILTLESAFVIRTFFFVIFGMTIALTSLMNLKVVLISAIIVAAMTIVRLIVLKMFKPKSIVPLLYLSPRGLITILLFFGIPAKYASDNFDTGILLFAIISTSLIMTYALISDGRKEARIRGHEEDDEILNLDDDLSEYSGLEDDEVQTTK